MVSDTGIIAASIISLIGMIFIFMLNNNNWFKRQNFKIQAANIKAENKLKLKKLERELGLRNVEKSPPDNIGANPSLLSSLAPLLKNMDGEQLKALAEQFLPEGAEETEPEGIGGMLLEFAQDNPELVQGLLKGITGKKDQDTGTIGEY